VTNDQNAAWGPDGHIDAEVLLFLHIPKTAGTSLTELIYDEYRKRRGGSGEYVNRARLDLAHGVLYLKENHSAGFFRAGRVPAPRPSDVRVLQRPDVDIVVGHFTFGLHRYIERPTSYITMLRDPVERVTSLYRHLLAYPDHYDVNAHVTRKRFGLTEFVTHLRLREADNDQVRRLSGMDAPFGQCSREMLERAKQNLTRAFLVVGITERFDESLALLHEHLGWRQERYQRRLVNRDHHGRGGLTEDELAVVSRQNALDLELYEYASEHFTDAFDAAGPTVRARAQRLARVNRPARDA
jgi:hypothetical protein